MNLVAQYLADSGMSQAELARRVGVSPVTVNQWVQGGGPSNAVAADLDTATGGAIPASYWVGRTDGRRRKPTKPRRRSRAA